MILANFCPLIKGLSIHHIQEPYIVFQAGDKQYAFEAVSRYINSVKHFFRTSFFLHRESNASLAYGTRDGPG